MVISILTLSKSKKDQYPNLFEQMFRGRALVFHERLRWQVKTVNGQEIDRYDEYEEPVYLLAVDMAGRLHGSLRLLPTVGPTMLQTEFKDFFQDDVDVRSPAIWECARFCVPPSGGNSAQCVSLVSAHLLIGLCALCLASGIEFIVGVYDTSMIRIYKRIGWAPELLAHCRPEIGNISVGIWEATSVVLSTLKEQRMARLYDQRILAA
jgi:acyl homoserine lactone synthase